MVKAFHPATGRKTVFTDMIWKNMGKNKMGWKVDSGEDASIEAAAADIQDSSDYLKLTDRAKGLLTDQNLQGALELFKKAQLIKNSSYIKGQINQIQAVLAAEEANASEDQFNQLVAEGDTALGVQDFATAVEKYGAALDIQDSEEVDEKFQTAQASLELN